MFQLLASTTLPKLEMFQVFRKIDVPHDVPHIYICDSVELKFCFLKNNVNEFDVPHDVPHIYICVFVNINEFDVPHDVPHIYMCFPLTFVLHVPHDVPHIYI